MHVILRDEHRGTERRTPLLPAGAEALVAAGYAVTVERSAKRVAADADFAAAGCALADPGTWTAAGPGTVVLGLKELPEGAGPLPQSHVYFAHAYKNQAGWRDLLGRFRRGGGTLMDLEYMADASGRRVAAFGYWAGYLGAALALIQWLDRAAGRAPTLDSGLAPFEDAAALDRRIEAARAGAPRPPRAVVIGALGRSGSGAVALLRKHGCDVSAWDMAETNPLDRAALLGHDILVNCVLMTGAIDPFVMPDQVTADTHLAVVADVSCDPTSPGNPLPFYTAPTSWDAPALAIPGAGRVFDLIAIDNLPSLLPRESSDDFAAQLLPHLLNLRLGDDDPVWASTRRAYAAALDRLQGEA
ncbi:MAG: saccharopine dehydrogenase [Hyphomicrobiales bacterium]|nr:saccharopine dehydrogenase [Hyphomicrobiales bacterium]MCP5373331.1 saccharopine dehydrogenase [Hyphomicrobiales bacterium]